MSSTPSLLASSEDRQQSSLACCFLLTSFLAKWPSVFPSGIAGVVPHGYHSLTARQKDWRACLQMQNETGSNRRRLAGAQRPKSCLPSPNLLGLHHAHCRLAGTGHLWGGEMSLHCFHDHVCRNWSRTQYSLLCASYGSVCCTGWCWYRSLTAYLLLPSQSLLYQ